MTAPSVNFFYGGGGLIQNVATTDVLFQPLVARQNLELHRKPTSRPPRTTRCR